jgi:hypothetical protein
MSLFERPGYQWRETFFVLFDEAQRPTTAALQAELESLGSHLQIADLRGTDDGQFESVTVLSPDDFSAMDITCVVGDEVVEQVPELLKELQPNLDTAEEKKQFQRLAKCSARLDVFHFAQQSASAEPSEDDEEFMDPGGLLIVLEHLAELCGGIVIDPQSASVM